MIRTRYLQRVMETAYPLDHRGVIYIDGITQSYAHDQQDTEIRGLVPDRLRLPQQWSSAVRVSSSDLNGISASTASAHALEWQHLHTTVVPSGDNSMIMTTPTS